MDRRTTYIVVAVVAVVVIAGAIIAFSSMGNNNNNNSSPEERTINYHGNGGTHNSLETYTTTSSTIPIITWDYVGHKAVGYTLTSDGTGTVYKTGDAVPNTTDLYVKYDAIKTTVNFSGPHDGLKVTINGTTVNSGDVIQADSNGTIVVCVENVTPGKYTFEKGADSYKNKYVVKEGETPVYSIADEGVSNAGTSNFTKNIVGGIPTYTMTNYESFTLTFAAISA